MPSCRVTEATIIRFEARDRVRHRGIGAAGRATPQTPYFALGHEGQTLTIIPSRQLVIVRLGLSIYIDAWNHAAFVAEVLDAI